MSKQRKFKVKVEYKHSSASQITERETYTIKTDSMSNAIAEVEKFMLNAGAIQSHDGIVCIRATEVAK